MFICETKLLTSQFASWRKFLILKVFSQLIVWTEKVDWYYFGKSLMIFRFVPILLAILIVLCPLITKYGGLLDFMAIISRLLGFFLETSASAA